MKVLGIHIVNTTGEPIRGVRLFDSKNKDLPKGLKVSLSLCDTSQDPPSMDIDYNVFWGTLLNTAFLLRATVLSNYANDGVFGEGNVVVKPNIRVSLHHQQGINGRTAPPFNYIGGEWRKTFKGWEKELEPSDIALGHRQYFVVSQAPEDSTTTILFDLITNENL